MAKQCGPVYFEKTFDELVLYKMDGQYYARKKSSLTGKRVKTSPEFRWTMALAGIMGRASKIGSAIYKALPPGWRQFWMYRSFTGEAFTLLNEHPYTDEEVKQILWKCYVGYWEQIKAADPDNPIWQPRPKKIRKRRVYSVESLLRQKDKYGKPKWRDPEEEERKRLAKERNNAAYERLLQKEKEKQQQQTEINLVLTHKQSEMLNATPDSYRDEIPGAWQVAADGILYSGENYAEINQAATLKEPETKNPEPEINVCYSSA